MTQEEFNVVFELQMRKCADILAHKKKEYTGDNIDRLSAFKIAAALQNCDPKHTMIGADFALAVCHTVFSLHQQTDIPVFIIKELFIEFLVIASYTHIFIVITTMKRKYGYPVRDV